MRASITSNRDHTAHQRPENGQDRRERGAAVAVEVRAVVGPQPGAAAPRTRRPALSAVFPLGVCPLRSVPCSASIPISEVSQRAPTPTGRTEPGICWDAMLIAAVADYRWKSTVAGRGRRFGDLDQDRLTKAPSVLLAEYSEGAGRSPTELASFAAYVGEILNGFIGADHRNVDLDEVSLIGLFMRLTVRLQICLLCLRLRVGAVRRSLR